MLLSPCAPRLHRAGPHCSLQSQGRTPPFSPLWQPQAWQDSLPCQQRPCSRQAGAKDSSVLQAGDLGLGMPPGCRAAQGHSFPSDRAHHPTTQPSLTREPPKAGCIPWECPHCSCLTCPGRQRYPSPEGSTGLHAQQGRFFTRPLPQALGSSSIRPDPLLSTGLQPRETFFRE